jgi:hypothetical protein
MAREERQKRLVAELRAPPVYYATGTCLAAAEEIERLQRELNSTLNLLYKESERRAEESRRIEQLDRSEP